MKPFDRRLITYARSAKGFIILTTVLGIVIAALVVAQALVIAHILGPLVTDQVDFATVRTLLIALAGIVAARAVAAWAQERYSHRAAVGTIQDLRDQVVRKAMDLGPRFLAQEDRRSHLGTLVTRGLGALEPYFVKYLPALFLAATVTPATLLVVLGLDWLSCLAIIITLPLLPLFMILIGRMTSHYAGRKLAAMTNLGAQILDLLAGLPTLKALGRERGPAARVRVLGEAHMRTTMDTLRVAFLSGAVMELLTTLSVALVAVEIGMRLVYGHIDLTTGLAVLILAPEIYLPIRQIGLHFHASSDGLAAASSAFDVLDRQVPPAGTLVPASLSSSTIVATGLGVRATGRGRLAPADLSFELAPHAVLALTGPNGAGKTTAVEVILGLTRPDAGQVVQRDAEGREIPLSQLDPAMWRAQFAWVAQRPTIWPGTVAENLRIGGEDIADTALAEAAAACGFDEVIGRLPAGLDSPIGAGGVGLSVGECQRLALTRALATSRQVVVLDEPTAHLDSLSEAAVMQAITVLRDLGRTVVIVTHRPALLALADTVVQVESGEEPNTAHSGAIGMAGGERA